MPYKQRVGGFESLSSHKEKRLTDDVSLFFIYPFTHFRSLSDSNHYSVNFPCNLNLPQRTLRTSRVFFNFLTPRNSTACHIAHHRYNYR